MAGWEEVEPEEVKPPDEPFKAVKQNIDPIVFAQTDSNPELRWSADMATKRPAPAPAPRPVSTGEIGQQWVPGGTPRKSMTRKYRSFGQIVRIVIAVMAPLGMISGIVLLFLRAYNVI